MIEKRLTAKEKVNSVLYFIQGAGSIILIALMTFIGNMITIESWIFKLGVFVVIIGYIGLFGYICGSLLLEKWHKEDELQNIIVIN